MKKITILAVVLMFSISCEKDDNIYPQVENITNGKKWTLEIGSTQAEVYKQLQELSLVKNFNDVALVYRQPFSAPNEIQSDISLYKSITLETTSGVTERILFQFDQDKVNSIEKGGALLETIPKWPNDLADENTIFLDDPISEIRQKLLAIYQIPAYQNLQIVLSNKWLEKPYDHIMSNYDEWAFSFSEDISPARVGRSLVRLIFNNEKLVKIRHEYNETELVN